MSQRRHRFFAVAGVGLCAALWTCACGDGTAEPAAPAADPPRPTTVTVGPATARLTALGETVQLTAEVRDQNGQAMAGATVTWASSAAAVATAGATGLVTAAGNGTATITATAGSASGSATVTVAQEVSTVTVTPAADTVVAGDTLRLAAEAADGNGHLVAGAEFDWMSSDTLVALVDDGGLVTGVGAGEAEVMATAMGVAGRATLTVLAPMPATVAVTPDTLTLTALGQTAQLAAEVRDRIGRVMHDVPVSWSSADTTVAAVDSAGLATAVGGGATTIAAMAGEVSGTAVVTVMQSAGSVVVSPAADTVAPGDTLRLAAEAFDENGHPVAGAEFAWSSGNASVATVDASGLVRGIGEGAATITAAAGDARGTSEITVENPDRAALVALYNATDGPNWVNNDNWLTDAPLRDWYGVGTDASGRVVHLGLSGEFDPDAGAYKRHGLAGEFPREVGNLAKLERLYLSHNNLWGPIPPELGNLSSLTELWLANNHLWGPIPPELGNLAALTVLSLHDNDLTGRIPSELGHLVSLNSLVLSDNDLAGAIPPELGSLGSLAELYLGGNSLSGSIPPELGNLANLAELWLGSNELTGPIPSELGNLVNLAGLGLGANNLTGPIPTELGSLTNLEYLHLGANELTGTIPRSLLGLDRLSELTFYSNVDLCAPGTTDFVAWIEGLERATGPFCNEADIAALESLFETAKGTGWTSSDGWLSGAALGVWHGVSADHLGRVTGLDLGGNGLAGRLPNSLGALVEMTELRLGDNARLAGHLPLSLADLSLQAFNYVGTGLCVPVQASFREWLNAIPSHDGTGVDCASLSDREILEALYDAGGRSGWKNDDNWLTDAPLGDWYGVRVDRDGRVTHLELVGNNLSGPLPRELGGLVRLQSLTVARNELTGPIPPELGNLAGLVTLRLDRNALTGPIPPELGNLIDLELLDLGDNALAGSIPPELGNLGALQRLDLDDNALAGPIPANLGRLSSLLKLDLGNNDLTGPVPPELGSLADLEEMFLDNSNLTGPVPAELGRLRALKALRLDNNAGMSGPLPQSLTGLGMLDALMLGGTDLCAPREGGFPEWLAGVETTRVVFCGSDATSAAYLTQAVQSLHFPVPLVARETALLRVFVSARRATGESMPPVRATFFLDDVRRHVVDIPSRSTPIPTTLDEGSLDNSANAGIPGEIVQPGLEMVIEIDPDETLDPALGIRKRIPESGRMTVDVREMPLLDLTLIPFVRSSRPDSTIVYTVRDMAANAAHHSLLRNVRTLLPVGDLQVTAHEPVLTSSIDALVVMNETEAIRAMEGGTGHYMGISWLTRFTGLAALGGRVSISVPRQFTIGHELGHNLSLRHAPCGAGGPDPLFPSPVGSIGAWGYDFRHGGLVPPSTKDQMGYCEPAWISDFHFDKALRYRLADEGMPPGAAVASDPRSLLLWGRADSAGVPLLEPAFVVDAPPSLPASVGEYRITGRTSGGAELFSLSFAMPATADGDGSSSFAFVLPVRNGWEGNLASITLTGLRGSFTLDGESNIPMAILRNPSTGQVRGILRDPPPATRAAADGGATSAPGLDILFSRGIPEVAAWRR